MVIFDVALEKRFVENEEISTINVSSADTLLIRDSTTGAIMRLSFSTLSAAISSAFGSSFASLVDGKVPASQLPSYVDDVLEYANIAGFPTTGESGKIYIAIDTNRTYHWSGSTYAEVSASLALGETSSTAYRGDRGKTAYDHSQVTTGNPHATTKADVGLSNVDNTSDSTKFTNPLFTGGSAKVQGLTTALIDIEADQTALSVNEAQVNLKSGLTYFRFFYRDSDKNFGFYHPSYGTVLRFKSGNLEVSGDLSFITAGKGLKIKEGSNARAGIATLVGGSIVVSNTSITANTRIKLTVQSLGTVATPKSVAITAKVTGTSFTITSSDNTDTSVVYWELSEPA